MALLRFAALPLNTLFLLPLYSLRWAQRAAQPRRSRGKHSDRVLRTKQGAVFGAALRFLQAPSLARRKNRLSARGTNGDRVLWQAHRSASCGRSSEVCLAQRSEFSSIILDAPKIQGTARGRNSRAEAGAALQFSQGRTAARWENWLSARGTNSDRVLWQAHRSASCGRSSEVCLAQRSEFSSIILDAQKIQGTARGRNSPCGLFPRRGMSRSDRGTH